MSNRRKTRKPDARTIDADGSTRPTSTPRAALDSLAGLRIPGGCEDCNAWQEVDQVDTGVYALAVVHDESCPWYRGVTR